MKNYLLLCATLVTTQLYCMELAQQTAPTTTSQQYTITDLQQAVALHDTAKVSLIVTSLGNQGNVTVDQYENLIQDAQHYSDTLNQQLDKWDLGWWKELLLGGGLEGFGIYELWTTGYTLYQSKSDLVTGLTSSSSVPLGLWAMFAGGVIIKRGYNDKVTTKINNVAKIQNVLTSTKSRLNS